MVAPAVGAPLASMAKPAPKFTSRGASVAGANWKALVEADASVPVTTALYSRLFGVGIADPAALKSKVPDWWQVTHFFRTPGYPIVQNPSVGDAACHVKSSNGSATNGIDGLRLALPWIAWTKLVESADQPLLVLFGL